MLRGLVFGELRQGALDSLVQDGLATAYGVPVATVRRAAMLLSSTTAAARLLMTGGSEALERVGLQVGTPIQPMLAASAPDVDRRRRPDRHAGRGRLQARRHPGPGASSRDDEVRIFTRSLDDITPRLPEVVAAVRALPATSLVLDGEVLALRDDGRPEAFQVIASRTASSTDVAGVSARTPLRVFFFDLLHLDGRDLLDAPAGGTTRRHGPVAARLS